ncbi:MAG: DUF418 domain-containing protein [Ferruginibacter sp.]
MISSTPARESLQDATPSTRSLRIESIDVLRGIAVLAALYVSVWIFGGFSNQQQYHWLQVSRGWNYRIYGAMELLINGKMRALIAIVFGAAMVIFLSKPSVPGKLATPELFIRRQMWLILFGLINAVIFLWTHDILFHLGIMGILLFPFVRMSYRGLFIAALLMTLIYCGKNFWSYADKQDKYQKYLVVTSLEKKYEKDSVTLAFKGTIKAKDTLTKLEVQDKKAWEGLLGSMKVDLKKDEGKVKAMHTESYGKAWNHLLPDTQMWEAMWTYQFGIWDFAGMIFLGMALYKYGFFANKYSGSKYLLLSLCCIAAGLLLGWFRLYYLQVTLNDFTKYVKGYAVPHDIFFPFERALLALGYAGLVLYFLSARLFTGICHAFSCAGKLALSNYILQTILCSLFFYGYGMGYFGRVNQFKLYVFASEMIIVQIAFSVIWLKYYQHGPAEWLLRKLYHSKERAAEKVVPFDSTLPANSFL